MADRLKDYRRKRDAQATPEPSGSAGAHASPDDAPAAPDGAKRYVVQEHHATRLHWDLRLEHDGVAVSWAVPNGIPEDPKDNRLAVHTEDHPLEYLEFEGDIPKGSYGAGTMRIWDRGTYEEHKFDDDKVEITFHGERLSRPLRPVSAQEAQGRAAGQGLDDPPHGSAVGSDAQADALEAQADARARRVAAARRRPVGL